MSDIAPLIASWAVALWLVFATLRWDEKRLTDAELARAWPPATRLAAGVYFGVICLPIHFWRTRRTLWGLLQGLLWGAVISVLDEGIAWGVEQLVPGGSPQN